MLARGVVGNWQLEKASITIKARSPGAIPYPVGEKRGNAACPKINSTIFARHHWQPPHALDAEDHSFLVCARLSTRKVARLRNRTGWKTLSIRNLNRHFAGYRSVMARSARIAQLPVPTEKILTSATNQSSSPQLLHVSHWRMLWLGWPSALLRIEATEAVADLF